jgi:hypothetical protein
MVPIRHIAGAGTFAVKVHPRADKDVISAEIADTITPCRIRRFWTAQQSRHARRRNRLTLIVMWGLALAPWLVTVIGEES